MLTAYVIVTLSMSIVSILFYGVDKIRSLKDVARIPEIVLIAVSAMGGVFGTMLVIRSTEITTDTGITDIKKTAAYYAQVISRCFLFCLS